MQPPAPSAPVGTRVWLLRYAGDEVPVDPRFQVRSQDTWSDFEEVVASAAGGSVTLVVDGEVLRELVAAALGIDPVSRSSLLVAPGQAVLLEVSRLGWMLVHSNARLPESP